VSAVEVDEQFALGNQLLQHGMLEEAIGRTANHGLHTTGFTTCSPSRCEFQQHAPPPRASESSLRFRDLSFE